MRFLTIGLFFLLSPSFSDLKAQSEDLGQTKLRSEWQESRSKKENPEEFNDRRWIHGPDEAYWVGVFREQRDDSAPTRIQSQLSQLYFLLNYDILEFKKLFDQGRLLLKNVSQRPVEGSLALLAGMKPILICLWLCLLLICCLHLSVWRAPLLKDFGKIFGIESYRSLAFALFATVSLGFYFQQLPLLGFLVSGVALVYSYRKTFFIYCFCFFFLCLITPAFVQILRIELDSKLAAEGLLVSRNHLSYSDHQIDQLEDWEKSVWASYNRNTGDQKSKLMASQPSIEKKILELNELYNPTDPESLIHRYEKIAKESPGHPTILFNLSQLYTQTQDLIAAEETRLKIPAIEYQEMLEKANRLQVRLLPPVREGLFTNAIFSFGTKSFQFFSFKENDFSVWLRLFYIASLAFIFLGGLLLRFKSSGLCRLTGEATPSIFDTHSRLAELFLQKSNDLDPSMRRRFQRAQKRAAQVMSERIKRWVFLLPSSYEVAENRPFHALLISLSILLLIFLGLPASWRGLFYAVLGLQREFYFGIFEFGPTLLVLGFVLYVAKVFHSRKRAED